MSVTSQEPLQAWFGLARTLSGGIGWPRGIFPGLEVTVAAPFESDDEWRASVIPQMHFALSKRGHVAVNLGFELPLLGARDDYRYRLHAFLLWDMADGGFWLGW